VHCGFLMPLYSCAFFTEVTCDVSGVKLRAIKAAIAIREDIDAAYLLAPFFWTVRPPDLRAYEGGKVGQGFRRTAGGGVAHLDRTIAGCDSIHLMGSRRRRRRCVSYAASSGALSTWEVVRERGWFPD